MSSSSPTPESWISSFCSLLGHEYFAEVSEDFIEDDFNLTGLTSQVPMYKEALEMILDVEPEEDEEEEDEEDEEEEDDDEVLGDAKPPGYRRANDRRHMRVASDLSVIESSAELLYGLIHQRYITSRPGIQLMAEKYELQHFGVCPRVFCNGCRVLPVGCSDTPGQETVKLFCPSCLDVYTPPNSRFQSVDGAFFGTTFGCLFFMTFPELDVGARGDGMSASPPPEKSRSSSLSNAPPGPSVGERPITQPAVINGTTPANLAPGLGRGKVYEPRIYGFRVSERAKSGPRMKWLRMKPVDISETDESKKYHEIHGGDEDEADEDVAMTQQGDVTRRKKASVRRRRHVVAGNAGSPMDTNGVGEGR
ncbi:MAG: casein kinase 2 regulatory subunit [Candelaria pacifica]|nr:MAG: casein kinase 2 regulatory subunit [Candelaria pacifica]